MELMIEDRLQALYDRARGGADMPAEVFRRLHFLARVLREGPEAAAPGVRLLWIDEQGKVAAAAVQGAGIMIGRDPACDVTLPSPRVSRRHCRVLPIAQGFLAVGIEDMGSSNGTLINGVRLPEKVQRMLRDGDVIEVGGVALAVAVPPVK